MKIALDLFVLSLIATFLLQARAAPSIPVWAQISADDFLVSEPPADGSAAHKRELDEMIEIQNGDRQAACAMARKQKYANFELLFARSRELTSDEAELAKPLVKGVMSVTQRITQKFKQHYGRSRPFVLDSRIETCADRPSGDTSYPSSHASMAAAGSCVLAEIFPAKAERLKKYGLYIGQVRMIVGAHHPSDVRAGQKLGLEVCRALLADSNFKRELRDLQQ